MTKLDDTMKTFVEAREVASAAQAKLAEVRKEAETIGERMVEAEREVRRTLRHARQLAQKISPLVHSEVAGLIGTHALPDEPEEDENSPEVSVEDPE